MRTLNLWRQQSLTAESQARLTRLIDAQRYGAGDREQIDCLLESFIETLTEAQLEVFGRLLTEMTVQVH
jgi:hypothetical protein